MTNFLDLKISCDDLIVDPDYCDFVLDSDIQQVMILMLGAYSDSWIDDIGFDWKKYSKLEYNDTNLIRLRTDIEKFIADNLEIEVEVTFKRLSITSIQVIITYDTESLIFDNDGNLIL